MSLDLQYGCVFCRTGKEAETVVRLEHSFPGLKAVATKKLRYRRLHGVAHEESAILFPGYVFFATGMHLRSREVAQVENVIRLLCDGEGHWQLVGEDKVIAEKLLSTGGTIGFSTAYYEGDNIRIVDGFLKEYEGSIIRVNHRAKTLQIKVVIGEKELKVWLGFELVKNV